MILLKDDTVIHAGLSSEMHYALGVAAALKSSMFGLNCVITSLLDGVHNPDSLHPKGKAGDLRTEDLKPTETLNWFQAVKAKLTDMGFDVVLETKVGATPETTAQHMHIEFDPKRRKFWNTVKEFQ